MRQQLLLDEYSKSRIGQSAVIFTNLFVVANRIQALFDREKPEITIKQYLFLIMVQVAGNDKNLTEISNLLGSSRQNVKRMAENLEEKGFLRIIKDPTDQRSYRIVFTEKLEIYFGKISKNNEIKLAKLFQPFDDSEVKALFTLILKLNEHILTMEE